MYRLDELKSKAVAVGKAPVLKEGQKKLTRRDYIKVLQEHYLQERVDPPAEMFYMLGMESLMLADRLKNQKEELQQEVWEDNNDWVAQTKVNGVRMVVFYGYDAPGKGGFAFYSRNLSSVDFLPIDYTNIWLGFDESVVRDFGIGHFVLDTEILCPPSKVDLTIRETKVGGTITKTQLTATESLLAMLPATSLQLQRGSDIRLGFHAIHLLELNGTDFREMPWEQMQAVLEVLVDKLNQAGMAISTIPYVSEGKKDFYQRVVDAGGEGVVLKRKDSVYVPTESRVHRQWLKAKRTASATVKDGVYGDSIDGFITDWKRGNPGTRYENMVGGLVVSAYVKAEDGSVGEQEIAVVANLDDEERRQMTIHNAEGVPSLNPEFYGQVVEVDGQWISSKSLRLVHPHMVRLRMDKSAEECVIEEGVLRAMII